MRRKEAATGQTNPESPLRSADIVSLLDRTQGHLILVWNAWSAPEVLRRIGLSTLYCCVALFLLVAFAVESFLQNQTMQGRILLTFAGMIVGCYVYLRATGDKYVTDAGLVALLGILCLFLLYTGGMEGAGPLWYYVFPLFALFVLRLWAGIVAVVVLFALTLILFHHPVAGFDPSTYPEYFRQRFLAVYVAVSIMAFSYAFLRASAEMELNNINSNLQKIANTDMLTRLPNRRSMEEILYREISRANRTGGVFSLILMDMDHFKSINDQYGHAGGDAVLQAIPGLSATALRRQDCIGRWGGEEFVLLLPETGLSGAVNVAERLRHAIETNRVPYRGQELSVTASFGVCEFRSTENLDDCVARADQHLYEAKAGGRNQVVS